MADKYLFGHTDFKNAYEVDDYPYGFNQRTKLRAWIETKPKKGDRFVTVTLNPKTQRWNKPKASTFSEIGVMYLDDKGHVKWKGVGRYSSPEEVKKFVDEIGGVKKLNKDQLKMYNDMTGGVSDEEITWKHKFDGDYALDIRFDVANQLKIKNIVEAMDEIIKKDGAKFKKLIDNPDGIIRIYGRKGSMIAGPSKAKSTYEQFKKFLKNKIREVNEAKKKLDTFEKHQLKIAKQTLKYNDIGAKIMGGMTKDEARAFLKKVGYSDKEIKKMEESKINEAKINQSNYLRVIKSAIELAKKNNDKKAINYFNDQLLDLEDEIDSGRIHPNQIEDFIENMLSDYGYKLNGLKVVEENKMKISKSRIQEIIREEIMEVAGFSLTARDKKDFENFLRQDFSQPKNFSVEAKKGGHVFSGSYTPIMYWKGDQLYIHNQAYGNVSQTYLNYARKAAKKMGIDFISIDLQNNLK